MIVASIQTGHGRSTPRAWLTVVQSELGNKRNKHKDWLLERLRQVIRETPARPEPRATGSGTAAGCGSSATRR
jgi:hypothetical protein